MISRLKNGDILIALEDPPSAELNTNDAYQYVARYAEHGMVYGERDNNHLVFHVSEGNYQTGARSHLLAKIIKNAEAPLGKCAVLRCSDKTIGKNFAKIVERWDPKLTPDELAARPVDKFGKVRLPTPFTDFFRREKDSDERMLLHELFRGFRAYVRSNANPVAPLSKEKGISCSNFVAYSFKAAIIDTLFPQGLPDNIQNMIELEYEILKGFDNNPNTKKLKNLDITFFQEFYDNVREQMNKLNLPDSLKETYFKFLCSPVKGYSIGDFCQQARLQFPQLFTFEGYLLLERDKQSLIAPHIISHEGYQALHKHHSNESSEVLMNVQSDVLAKLKSELKTAEDKSISTRPS